MIAALTYSIAGLSLGFILGLWVRFGFYREVLVVLRRRRHHPESAVRPEGQAHYDAKAAIPTVIPAVRFDPSTGEPIIAKEEVHHPSPVPRSIAIILILLACLSVTYLFYQKTQDNDRLRQANNRLSLQVRENTALTLQLQHQQEIINGNERRLENLVLAISTAKTPGEVTAAIHQFLKSSAAARQQEQRFQNRNGGGQGSAATTQPSNHTKGSTNPKPPSNHPSSHPTHHPSPSPKPSPSPTTTPPVVMVCITTPIGRVCEPAPNITSVPGKIVGLSLF